MIDTMTAAVADSVTELEISIDCQVFPEFESVEVLTSTLHDIFQDFPSVTVRPEIGINREWDEARCEEWVVPLIETGYFAAIDLYGNELFGEPEEFTKYYELARRRGMRCKAHAGEYRDAEFVRRSVEVLQLDEVQHGISAAQSKDVMQWLARHQIRLNICPTSNLRLARIAKMSEHPIRTLVHADIPVTINTDDLLVFDQTVSEEYLNLFEARVLTAVELDEIRQRAFRELD
jgi:adenosine deaminase